MRFAAAIAFVVALAASGAASAQGVGLRVGNAGAWIAPSLDWKPSSGPFRLTAGLMAQDTRADLGLSARVEPENTNAPYLGIGYGRVPREGLNFYFDLGVIYQGACSASISSTPCAQYPSDAPAERYGLARSLDKYGLYPVGRVGVRVGF